jgi:hypothetical protein
MRAIQRTKFFRLGLLYTVVGALSGVVACANSLHLDPAGALPRADGGPDAGVACTSNLQCIYPTLCDTVAEICVECLVTSDCTVNAGTVCSYESCVCPPPLMHCSGTGAGSPYCVDSCGAGGAGGGGQGGAGGAASSSAASSGGGADAGHKDDGGPDGG